MLTNGTVALQRQHPEHKQRDEIVANTAEVLCALQALAQPQLLRMKKYARFRMRAIGDAARGRNDEDLLGEALTATLSGQRRWKPLAVDFEKHMLGAMRSISSHWTDRKPHLSLEDAPHVASLKGDPERELAAKEEIAAIRAHFAHDVIVLGLLEDLSLGLTGPEIKLSRAWSQADLETAMRRLRRGVERMGGGRRA